MLSSPVSYFIRDYSNEKSSIITINFPEYHNLWKFQFVLMYVFRMESEPENKEGVYNDYTQYQKFNELIDEMAIKKYELSFLAKEHRPYDYCIAMYVGSNENILQNLQEELIEFSKKYRFNAQIFIEWLKDSVIERCYQMLPSNETELVESKNNSFYIVLFEEEMNISFFSASDKEKSVFFKKQRNIEHFIYEENGDNILKIEEFAKENNYECEVNFRDEETIRDWEGVERVHYFVVLRKNDTLENMDNDVFKVRSLTESLGAEYYWWECETFVKE